MFYVIVSGTTIREALQSNPVYFKRQDNGINILSDDTDYDYIYSSNTDISYDRITHVIYEFDTIPESDNITRDYIIVNNEFIESDYLILSKRLDDIGQGSTDVVYDDIANAIREGVNSI